MASPEDRYPVYYRRTRPDDNRTVEELERIIRGEKGAKPRPKTAKPKRSTTAKTNIRKTAKKAAKQTTEPPRTGALAALVIAGLGITSFMAIPKLFGTSETDNPVAGPTPTYVTAPQSYTSDTRIIQEAAPTADKSVAFVSPTHQAEPQVAAQTKNIAPVIRNELQEAQSIINSPMSDAERFAKPFVDRMLNNRELMGLIDAVSATTNTPVPTLMEVIAAETGGRPGNPLQVTPLQFPQLLGTYGNTYADKMESYAKTQPTENAKTILKQAAELRFVAQFMKRSAGSTQFVTRDDLYKQHMQGIYGKKAKFPSFAKRIDGLYHAEYVRTGMQALSNNADGERIKKLLDGRDPKKVFGTDAIFRLANYFGITRAKRFSEISHKEHLPVIGNLMSRATAEANKVDYNIAKTTVKVRVKVNGHFKEVEKQVEKKIPVTIGELKERQLEPWDGIQAGIRGQLARDRAKRLLTAQNNPQATNG